MKTLYIMTSHFCRIGQANEKISTILNVHELEQQYKGVVEKAYNLSQSDSALSDALYHEATLLEQRINKLKASFAYNYVAA